MFALGTNVYVFGIDLKSVVITFFTYEPMGLSGIGQVLVTGDRVAKTLVKFNFGFGKIFMHCKIYHGGLLLLSFIVEAIINAGCDRSGHNQSLFLCHLA